MSDPIDLQWPQEIPSDYFNTAANERNLFHVDFLTSHFRDFARANLYVVQLKIRKDILAGFSFLGDSNLVKVQMLAKTANLPNYEISKLEIKRMGEKLFLPASQNYGDLQFTMLSDDLHTQRKFFHSWMKHSVYDSDNNTYSPVANLKYATIEVYQLDNKFNAVFGAEFTHVWPTSIGEIQLSQDSENQLVEFPVVFAYSQYKILTPSEETFKKA